ncbi:uncharacterized protein LOC126978998 [Leptidea sinapis]|uniref:uncharacterized protein LOC126978998 n=1 Tax=Leptidea sinapis TaxID=189913 RepID=UPI0021C40361|nr:uncharacterized protein LOC126978998 [Leptidea sinapis]
MAWSGHPQEPYVSNFILEKASTSTTFLPVAADASQQFTSARCLMLEHNYSFISKPKGTAGKDLMAPQRTKIKHLQAEISRWRKKGQSFKARLKGGADRSIEFCQENLHMWVKTKQKQLPNNIMININIIKIKNNMQTF